MRYQLALVALFLIVLSACGGEPGFTPKPRAYPRVIYPEKEYQAFDKDYCAFTFQYPAYAEVQQDTSFFEERPPHPCWFDLYFPDFDARLHCSYIAMKDPQHLQELKSEAFELVDWHNKKANYIEEIRIQKENDVSGFAFLIEGPAASPFQFYLTDSVQHYLRASLYFNTQARPDSLAPVFDFLEEDIQHMITTFEWAAK